MNPAQPSSALADKPHQYHCPLCGGRLWRKPRHVTDFIVSAFTPVWRFHCRFIACQWEGRLRVRPEDLAQTAELDRRGML